MNNNNNIIDNSNSSFFNVNNDNSWSIINRERKQKNNVLAIVLSIIAIIISVVAIISTSLTYTFKIDTIVPIFGIMITILITWQIYNSIDINKRVSEYEKTASNLSIEIKSLYEMIDKSEIITEALTYISYIPKYQVANDSYATASKAIGFNKYCLAVNSAFYFLQCTKLILEVKITNKNLKKDMLYTLHNRISDCVDIIEAISEISSTKEFRQAYSKYPLKDELKLQVSYILKFLNDVLEAPLYIEEIIKSICDNIEIVEQNNV